MLIDVWTLVLLHATILRCPECLDCFLQRDFFIILHDILANMAEVSKLQPVPDAYVPVMKFNISGISVDLLYASIPLLVVPEVSSLRNAFALIFPPSIFYFYFSMFIASSAFYGSFFSLPLLT